MHKEYVSYTGTIDNIVDYLNMLIKQGTEHEVVSTVPAEEVMYNKRFTIIILITKENDTIN